MKEVNITDKELGKLLWWEIPENVNITAFNETLKALDLGIYEVKNSAEAAFKKAASKVKTKDQIARALKGEAKVQLTSEVQEEGQLKYTKDATVSLVEGKVTVDGSPDLELLLKDKFEKELNTISSTTVSQVIGIIISNMTDLFAVKNRNSVYLVPTSTTSDAILDKIDTLLTSHKGTLYWLNINRQPKSLEIMRSCVKQGLLDINNEWKAQIAGLKPGTRKSTLTKISDELKLLEAKAEGYGNILEDELAVVKATINENKKMLRDAIGKITEDLTSAV